MHELHPTARLFWSHHGPIRALKISPLDLGKNIFHRLENRPQSLKESLNETTKRKKENYLEREIKEVQAILESTGRGHKFPQVSVLSMFLFVLGGSVAILKEQIDIFLNEF